MKFAIFLVIFTFVLALSLNAQEQGSKRILKCLGKDADSKALENLMKKGKPIGFKKLKIDPDCVFAMAEGKSGNSRTGVKYNPRKTCFAIGNSDKSVSVVPPGDCGKLPPTQAAMFLPQDDDSTSFMILSPTKAPWFFTAELSGCDVFVATSRGSPTSPMIIHSNLNSCGNKVENLERKGQFVDDMLRSHSGYQLVARVYSEADPKYKKQTDAYWKKYRASHRGIKLIAYNLFKKAQPFQFIGNYKKSWKFIVKGEIDGNTQTV